MYERINPGRVRHHSGFEVARTGRDDLEYFEEGRCTRMQIEANFNRHGEVTGYGVYPDSLKSWKTQRGLIPMTKEEKKLVAERMIEAQRFMTGLEVSIG